MKILILSSLILIYSQSCQCGAVKNVAETVASEVHKIVGYIENSVANKNTSNIKHEENNGERVSSKVIISEQNSNDVENQKNNNSVQVNVEITLVVNYDTPNTKPGKSLKDKNKDLFTDNLSNTTKIVTDPVSVNVEQSSIKVASIDVQNIKFPGPMNSPIITYKDGVVVVEANDTSSNDVVLFPDSKMNTTEHGCPVGMFLSENGFCLIDDKGEKSDRDKNGVSRAAFSGGCLQGYARALDGSCQQIIED